MTRHTLLFTLALLLVPGISWAEKWDWTLTPGTPNTFTASKVVSFTDSTLMQSFSGTYTTDATTKAYTFSVTAHTDGTESAPANGTDLDGVVLGDGLLFADLQLYSDRARDLIVVPAVRSVGCPTDTLSVNYLGSRINDTSHGDFSGDRLWGYSTLPVSGGVDVNRFKSNLGNIQSLDDAYTVASCSNGVINLGGSDRATISSSSVGNLSISGASFLSVYRTSGITTSVFNSQTLYGVMVGTKSNHTTKFQRLVRMTFNESSNPQRGTVNFINKDDTAHGESPGTFNLTSAGTDGTATQGFVKGTLVTDLGTAYLMCAVDNNFAGRSEYLTICTGAFHRENFFVDGITMMLYSAGGTLTANAQKTLLQIQAPYTP